MLRKLSSRLHLDAFGESGMSIVEVVVALFVFAIISTGIASGAMTISRLTADSRSREVAANLAAKDLDSTRSIADPFDVHADSYTTTVSGRDYSVVRTTSWVSIAGSDTKCGSTDNLRYRRITATVTWAGQLSTTAPVTSTTVLAPLQQTVDASSGAISIGVTNAKGQPQPGIAVSLVPVSGGGGTALASQPDPTDVDGCAYASQVAPGTYTAVLSKDGYVDTSQVAKPTTVISVAAGSTAGWSVVYDKQATFSQTFADNYTANTVLIPNNLDVTYLPNDSSWPAATLPAASSAKLFPFISGYTAAAGAFANSKRVLTCASEDPAAWQAGKVSGTDLTSGSRASGIPDATNNGSLAIPMGVVKVTLPLGTWFVTATTSSRTGKEVAGDPGCATPATYTFDRTTSLLPQTVYVALPYGAWTLTYGAVSGSTLLTVGGNALSSATAVSNAVTTATSTSGGTVTVTLDPRTRS